MAKIGGATIATVIDTAIDTVVIDMAATGTVATGTAAVMAVTGTTAAHRIAAPPPIEHTADTAATRTTHTRVPATITWVRIAPRTWDPIIIDSTATMLDLIGKTIPTTIPWVVISARAPGAHISRLRFATAMRR